MVADRALLRKSGAKIDRREINNKKNFKLISSPVYSDARTYISLTVRPEQICVSWEE